MQREAAGLARPARGQRSGAPLPANGCPWASLGPRKRRRCPACAAHSAARPRPFPQTPRGARPVACGGCQEPQWPRPMRPGVRPLFGSGRVPRRDAPTAWSLRRLWLGRRPLKAKRRGGTRSNGRVPWRTAAGTAALALPPPRHAPGGARGPAGPPEPSPVASRRAEPAPGAAAAPSPGWPGARPWGVASGAPGPAHRASRAGALDHTPAPRAAPAAAGASASPGRDGKSLAERAGPWRRSRPDLGARGGGSDPLCHCAGAVPRPGTDTPRVGRGGGHAAWPSQASRRQSRAALARRHRLACASPCPGAPRALGPGRCPPRPQTRSRGQRSTSYRAEAGLGACGAAFCRRDGGRAPSPLGAWGGPRDRGGHPAPSHEAWLWPARSTAPDEGETGWQRPAPWLGASARRPAQRGHGACVALRGAASCQHGHKYEAPTGFWGTHAEAT